MIDINNIQILQQQPEGQQFDRKSFRIDAKALAVIVVAFANADGGDVVIGIEGTCAALAGRLLCWRLPLDGWHRPQGQAPFAA